MKRYLAKRLAVTVAIAAVLVLGAAAVPLLDDDPQPTEVEYPEYDTGEIVAERLPADGEIEPDGFGVGTVTVDASANNQFDREDISPLIRGFNRAGYDAEINRDEDLSTALDDTDVFVVIDPISAYDREDVDEIESFVDDGGRLLILGQPNRIAVGPMGGVAELRTETTELEAAFNIHFDTRYVYDMERNDGNYRHVITSPGEEVSVDDVEDVTLYTPAEVRSTDSGTPLLVTSPTARTAQSDEQRQHTLAVADGNVVAIGDATFITEDRYNVGDNDEFLAQVIDALVTDDPLDE